MRHCTFRFRGFSNVILTDFRIGTTGLLYDDGEDDDGDDDEADDDDDDDEDDDNRQQPKKTKQCKLKMHFSHRSDPRNLQLWEALQEYRRSEANGNLNEAGLTSKLLL